MRGRNYSLVRAMGRPANYHATMVAQEVLQAESRDRVENVITQHDCFLPISESQEKEGDKKRKYALDQTGPNPRQNERHC